MNKKKEIVPKLRFPEFVNEDEWKNKRIKQLLTIGNGCDYKHLSKGDIPVYGSGGYMCSVDDFLYDGDSVCIGRKGTIDKPIFLRGKFWTVDTLFYTHSYKNCIPKFIYNVFQRINWLKYNEAGGVPSLSKTIINKINIYIPKIPEQQKIADCLSSIDDLIDAESRKLKALEKYKKGLMQKLFPVEGKTLPEWRFPEFQGCEEWKSKSVGKACKMFSGGTPDTSQKEFYGGAIPFIRSAEINKSSTELFITEEGFKNSSAKMVKKGDILIALYGANSGEVALSKIDGAINQAILCLRHETNNVFVYHYFTHMKNQIISKYIQGGQGNLSGQIIKSVNLYFPKTEEQQKIADCLSVIDTIITEQSNKVEQLKAHKKGLMQGLFPSLEEADV